MNDTVVMRVNGKEVFRKPNVETRLQIGRADSYEVSVQEDTADVEVTLPSRDLSKSVRITLDESAPVYLGLSLTPEGEISEQVSREPFGYL